MGSVFCEKGCEWEFVNKQFRTSVVPREMDVSCVPKISVLTRNSSGEGSVRFLFWLVSKKFSTGLLVLLCELRNGVMV